jgi:hypothetical protein
MVERTSGYTRQALSHPTQPNPQKIARYTRRTRMQEMTPDEASVALYKCMYYNRQYTSLEEVQQYVEAGARLRDIETLFGPPLLCALNSMCKPPILKYLIEKGGIDWEYKKGKYTFYSEVEPTITLLYITYNTILNELIHMWHFCKGSYKADNQVLRAFYRINKITDEKYNYKYKLFRYPFEVDEYYDEEFCKELNIVHEERCKRIRETYGETYAQEVCELFGITPEELEDGILELPEKTYDKTLLPAEDKPYCWNNYMHKPVGYAFHELFIFPDSENEESDGGESGDE